MVSADGKGELVNLTNSGYTSSSPKWTMDGNAILFTTERYGMRNHASWGSLDDVMMVFVNQDAYDKFRMSKEDYELQKELEKEQEKAADKKDGKKEDKKEDKKEEADKVKDIVVELEGIQDRIVRLTRIHRASLRPFFQRMEKVCIICRLLSVDLICGRWICANGKSNCYTRWVRLGRYGNG